MKILIVDDEPIIQETLKSTFESMGHQASTVKNGLEALNILSEKDFNMVLMDLRMPVMDGLTATKFLRSCEQGMVDHFQSHQHIAKDLIQKRNGTRIPIVGVSGNIGDRDIALQAGIDEYINKPFKLDTIYEVLDRFDEKS